MTKTITINLIIEGVEDNQIEELSPTLAYLNTVASKYGSSCEINISTGTVKNTPQVDGEFKMVEPKEIGFPVPPPIKAREDIFKMLSVCYVLSEVISNVGDMVTLNNSAITEQQFDKMLLGIDVTPEAKSVLIDRLLSANIIKMIIPNNTDQKRYLFTEEYLEWWVSEYGNVETPENDPIQEGDIIELTEEMEQEILTAISQMSYVTREFLAKSTFKDINHVGFREYLFDSPESFDRVVSELCKNDFIGIHSGDWQWNRKIFSYGRKYLNPEDGCRVVDILVIGEPETTATEAEIDLACSCGNLVNGTVKKEEVKVKEQPYSENMPKISADVESKLPIIVTEYLSRIPLSHYRGYISPEQITEFFGHGDGFSKEEFLEILEANDVVLVIDQNTVYFTDDYMKNVYGHTNFYKYAEAYENTSDLVRTYLTEHAIVENSNTPLALHSLKSDMISSLEMSEDDVLSCIESLRHYGYIQIGREYFNWHPDFSKHVNDLTHRGITETWAITTESSTNEIVEKIVNDLEKQTRDRVSEYNRQAVEDSRYSDRKIVLAIDQIVNELPEKYQTIISAFSSSHMNTTISVETIAHAALHAISSDEDKYVSFEELQTFIRKMVKLSFVDKLENDYRFTSNFVKWFYAKHVNKTI